MLCTSGEAMQILRLSEDVDLSVFDDLLEYAQADLVEYLDNHFQDSLITYTSRTIAFVPGSPDTITDSDDQFIAEGFTSGDIAVEYAYANNGIHGVASVAAGTLTLTTTDELVAMSPTDPNHPIGPIKISRVDWPKALKLDVAKMAWFLYTMDGARPDDMRAKTIDGTVVQYAGTHAYPSRILSGAKKWRRARFV